jgi:hypothetical protein
MIPSALVFLLLTGAVASSAEAGPSYLVFVDPGPDGAFRPAAEALAALHGGTVATFERSNLQPILQSCRRDRPDHVVFVLPPGEIDVDLAHEIISLSAVVDEDPFIDFEYGFVTGRDGEAARRFVERIAAARKRRFGRTVSLFGTWEGPVKPAREPMTFFPAIGFNADARYVMARDPEEKRRDETRESLKDLRGRDGLLFFSHGYPDEMAGCFRARDLRDWKIDLSPAVFVSCACWNGAPGRWFAPGPDGPVDRGVVKADDSVALALIDSGVSGFIGGIDPWHGPLAMQVFSLITADGMRLGEAAKRMLDRLAMEFHPEAIQFKPTLDNKARFAGEGTNNRRHNGAGMILYGDPAFSPFARTAARPAFAVAEVSEAGVLRIRLGTRPLVKEGPGQDFMIPMNRLVDYYSVRTADFAREIAMEVYEVVPLPEGVRGPPALKVASARSGTRDAATGEPQALVEETPRGRLLHVRVPLKEPLYSPLLWPQHIATHGLEIRLEGRVRAASQ